MHDNATKSQDEPFSISEPASLSSYFSSTSSSSSLSSSPPNTVRLRSSMSTPLLKTRQSTPVSSSTSSSTAAPRLPKWIKHVSQTSGLLEKKLSRGFPFRSTVPLPLHLAGSQDSTTAKALYCGSPLVRQYLNSVTKVERFDNMLQTGFPCPHSLHLYQQDQKEKRKTTHGTKNNSYDDDEADDPSSPAISKKPRCPLTCHQCGGQQRLMTLRVTLTPLHARANENDIYKNTRKRSKNIRHTTHPITTTTSPF
ncbi:hypothetical protein BCR42DRAFT_429243 [Absidia repens]|uniref:Uncharacterized protein n=1 Tax=Absidia repens TaxID=90262 RepID=A0A1X2HYH9_9FUNG|nr:hypothetical protein BCR42DRAFT_429243 [Absidia repens]